MCACIRVLQNVSLSLDDIKSYCDENMAHFKIPSKLVIVDSFPKTVSGKIQKFKLRESICKEK